MLSSAKSVTGSVFVHLVHFQHHHPNPAPILAWLNRSIDNVRDALHRSTEFNRWIERRQQFRELTRDFYETSREQFLQHPFVERLRQDSQRLAVNFYKRALPFLSQVRVTQSCARNSHSAKLSYTVLTIRHFKFDDRQSIHIRIMIVSN